MQVVRGHKKDITSSQKPKYIKSDRITVKVFLAELAQKNQSPDYKILISDLIDILTTDPQFGFTKLKAAQIVRWLVEKEGKLRPVEDSGLVSFTLNRNISEYEARQQELQDAYLRNEEGKILDVLDEEDKEIQAAAKLEADTKRFNNNRKMWRKKKQREEEHTK